MRARREAQARERALEYAALPSLKPAKERRSLKGTLLHALHRSMERACSSLAVGLQGLAWLASGVALMAVIGATYLKKWSGELGQSAQDTKASVLMERQCEWHHTKPQPGSVKGWVICGTVRL
jgi:hypothetical protein